MSEGARVWLIPDGFIPEESSGAQESHETICALNIEIPRGVPYTIRVESNVPVVVWTRRRPPSRS